MPSGGPTSHAIDCQAQSRQTEGEIAELLRTCADQKCDLTKAFDEPMTAIKPSSLKQDPTQKILEDSANMPMRLLRP